jgi:uncharacterized protein
MDDGPRHPRICREDRFVTGRRKPELNASSVTAAAVAAYLRGHPTFLVEHPEILLDLVVPHVTGEAVSLIEHQVAVLREQNQQIQARYRELLAIGRENERLLRRLHRLTLQLIATAGAPEKCLQTLYDSLLGDFRANLTALRIFACFNRGKQRSEFVGKDSPEHALFVHVIKARKPICGRLRPDQRSALFGQMDKEVASATLIPLSGNSWTGLLAIGSPDPKRYFPGMGVDLLEQLGEILSLIIDPWVVK